MPRQYLAIGSYVATHKVVRNQAEVSKVMPVMGELFLGQGYSESWSESSFDDYLALGPGKNPMIAIYESQYLEYLLRNDGSITEEMVLMYPSPDVLSKHTLIGLSGGGARLGDALREDAELQRLAAQHGFRTVNPTVFLDAAERAEIATGRPPVNLGEVVAPPRYEVLESMITQLSKLY